ncbi:MAG: DUF2461 domain-containing protein [Myxococcota bacterium]
MSSIFSGELFEFLSDLAEHNDRDWFAENKPRYEANVLEPCLEFIRALGPALADVSPRFPAIAKKQGGSMFRIYRDTRFSKDKSPYKTHVGLQFRHELASRDVHAPGFYLHIEPGNVAVGAGMWHPESKALRRIRDRIVADSEGWSKVRAALDGAGLAFMGDSLKRPPKGFDKDHPHMEDLKRKDVAVHRKLTEEALTSDAAVETVATEFDKAQSLVRFLCESQDLPFV